MARSFARAGTSMVAGIYTIIATHLLAYLLVFAAAGVLFHLVVRLIAAHLGFVEVEAMWAAASERTGFHSLTIRLVIALTFHVLGFWLLKRPFRWFRGRVNRVFDGIERLFLKDGRKSILHTIAYGLFMAVVTILIIPFLIQPTLVSRAEPASTKWSQRLANLLDGTASVELTESVPGYYRRWFAGPVAVGGVDMDDLERVIAEREREESEPAGPIDGPTTPPTIAKSSMMDRWDGHIRHAVRDTPELFPVVKAFMYVESGGRQFCVSRTGCAGLMQFCTGTARSDRYRDIFGRGAVYRCACSGGRCKVSRKVQRDLELGNFAEVEANPSLFPCELTDARFVPERALEAGTKYIRRMHNAYGGNIYLMYIGYNSGPGVATRVWKALGKKPEASLAEIAKHLERALVPSFGTASGARARSLVRTHLPKLARARDRYAADMRSE